MESKCEVASCIDGLVNGVESDIDCGGKYECNKCADLLACKVDVDCASGYCSPDKTCAPAPACADKQLSQGESDVDCGGPCDGCVQGKSCQSSSDCVSGLSCAMQVCGEGLDEDSDGVVDGMDNCSQTPLGESVDENGCAPSQVSSKSDGITDKWRVDYFGCIECDEAAADNDADADGLTNLEEFKEGTNPVDEDSDGDGWADGDELESGTDPTNPASHPNSSIGVVLWILFALLALGGLVYGGYLLREVRRHNAQAIQSPPVIQQKVVQDSKLRSFAKKEEAQDSGWLSMGELKKQKPAKEVLVFTPVKDPNPLNSLKGVVKRLSPEEQAELRERADKLDSLSKKERDVLFDKLKITASFYDGHKKEVKKELKKNG